MIREICPHDVWEYGHMYVESSFIQLFNRTCSICGHEEPITKKEYFEAMAEQERQSIKADQAALNKRMKAQREGK